MIKLNFHPLIMTEWRYKSHNRF